MKTLIKIRYLIIAFLLSASIASPIFAESPLPKTTVSNRGICGRLTTLEGNKDEGIGDRIQKLDTGRTTRQNDLTARRANVDSELKNDRTKWFEDRQEQFVKLEARAKTDAQKAAVSTFETTIKNAIATREAAVDAAIAAYRSGVDALIKSRQTAVDAAINTFKTSVSAAFSKAQSDCSSGVDSQTVRTNLQSSIKAARTQLKTDIQNATNTQGQLQQLATTRKSAVQAAISTFKTTAQAAVSALKAAFGKSSGGSTSSATP